MRTSPPQPIRRLPPPGLSRRLWAVLLLALALPSAPRAQGGNVGNVADIAGIGGIGDIELVPGREVERELGGKESHRYPLSLATGEFLRALVTEEGGLDVAVRLVDPAGKELVHVDGPNQPREAEDLAAIAPEAGLYQLEVRAGGKAGRYRLRIERRPVGDVGNEERARVEAVRLTQSATELMLKKGRDSLLHQIEEREAALALWQRLGEKGHVAAAYYQLGTARWRLDDKPRAAEELHRSAALWGELGETLNQADALDEAAYVERKLSRWEETRRHLEEACSLLAAPGGDASTLRIVLLNNLGSRLIDLGQPGAAVPCLKEARKLAQQAKDPRREVNALNSLGSAYIDLDERQEALRSFQSALALARKGHDSEHEPNVLNNLGNVYYLLGEWEKALDSYRQSLQLGKDLKSRAKTLNNMGDAQEKLAQTEAARQSYLRSIALAKEVDDRGTEAQALDNLGYLELNRHRPAQALESCRQALALALATGDRGIEAAAREAIGVSLRDQGDLDAAGRELESARTISHERGDRNREANVLLNLSRVARVRRDLGGAITLADSALQLVESLRTQVASLDFRASFQASVQSYYEHYIDTLMAAGGQDAQALGGSERARARSLLDLLDSAGIRGKIPRELLERERQASEKVSLAERRRAEVVAEPAADSQAMAEAVAARDTAIDEYKRVEGEVRAASPRYASLTHPLTRLSEIQKLLDQDTLLLEYSLGEERSYLWAVTPKGVRGYRLPRRRDIEKVARRFYEQVTARSRDPQAQPAATDQADRAAAAAARELSKMVLAPAASLLGDRRLVVVPDGALQYIPFAALPDPAAPAAPPSNTDRCLVDAHEIVRLPSASVLAVLRKQQSRRPPPPRTLAVVGDPVFQALDERVRRTRSIECSSQVFSRLPFAGEEAKAILKLVPSQNALPALGLDASLPLVTSGKLSHYGMIHFATHGCIDNRHPELSGLVLSRVDARGRSQNGILWLKDIYNLRLNADLVVLSACQTALGKEIQGEGLIGLTRGFLYAGSSRVVASLWKVDDLATYQLMRRFYGSMLGKEPQRAAAALRQAQLEMRRDPRWSSPYYWAAFSLQGEWR